ncbi:MAG: hypothetical protein U0903_11745 [Planctomycetales bacterium]
MGMFCLIHLLGTFLGASPAGELPQKYDIAVQVKRYTFEKEDDLDFDQQPDDWSRREGVDFPKYVKAVIDRGVGFQSPSSLRFDLNGARAVYYSKPEGVDTEHSYFLRGRIKTEGMQYNAAQISVSFLNVHRQRIRRWMTTPVSKTEDWTEVELGPLNPDPEVKYILVGCHIVTGDRLDVRGMVWFDDIWLGQAPRLSIRTNSDCHVFMQGDKGMRIETDVQGVDAIATKPEGDQAAAKVVQKLVVELRDNFGDVVKIHEWDIDTDKNTKGTESSRREPYVWKLMEDPDVAKILANKRLGTYSAEARLKQNERSVLLAKTAFAILDKPSALGTKEFGWSFPKGLPEMAPQQFAELASEAGLGWMKIPLWSSLERKAPVHGKSHQDQELPGAELASQIAELEKRRITTIGLLNDPPLRLRRLVDDSSGISGLFQLPVNEWYPTLEPVLARFSFMIRYWQLGDDKDKSFVGMVNIGKTLTQIKGEFDRIGRDVLLGVHWPANARNSTEDFGSHQFLSVGDPEGYSHKAILNMLNAVRAGKAIGFASIELPPGKEISREERVASLAKQVVTAKLSQSRGIILDDPTDKTYGILNPDGTPSDLFVPWRVLTQTLTGAKYARRMNFRNGSMNVAFEKDGEMMLVVWREDQSVTAKPVEERAFLGDSVQILDLWGNIRTPEKDLKTHEQKFHVSGTPVFLLKCSEPILRWQTAVKFEKGKISSEYGSHSEAILGLNTFGQGVSGVVRLHMPRDWKVEPREWPLQLGVGEKFKLPMSITFPPQGCLGKVESRLEFDFVSDRQYHFNMVIPYEIGLGDVRMVATQRYLPNGNLEIKQVIVNNTSEVMSFKCILIVPGEKRQMQEVVKLGKSEDTKIYFLSKDVAARLVGKELLLKVEQTPGRRVMNFKCKVDAPRRIGENGETEEVQN